MLRADLIAQFAQLLAAEFNDLTCRYANQVIVYLPADYNIVVRSLVVEEDLLEDAGVLKMGERAIHGRPAHSVTQLPQIDRKLLGLKKGGFAQNSIKNHRTFGREFQFLAAQILAENRTDRFVWPRFRLGRGTGKVRQNVRAGFHAMESTFPQRVWPLGAICQPGWPIGQSAV